MGLGFSKLMLVTLKHLPKILHRFRSHSVPRGPRGHLKATVTSSYCFGRCFFGPSAPLLSFTTRSARVDHHGTGRRPVPGTPQTERVRLKLAPLGLRFRDRATELRSDGLSFVLLDERVVSHAALTGRRPSVAASGQVTQADRSCGLVRGRSV